MLDYSLFNKFIINDVPKTYKLNIFHKICSNFQKNRFETQNYSVPYEKVIYCYHFKTLKLSAKKFFRFNPWMTVG